MTRSGCIVTASDTKAGCRGGGDCLASDHYLQEKRTEGDGQNARGFYQRLTNCQRGQKVLSHDREKLSIRYQGIKVIGDCITFVGSGRFYYFYRQCETVLHSWVVEDCITLVDSGILYYICEYGMLYYIFEQWEIVLHLWVVGDCIAFVNSGRLQNICGQQEIVLHLWVVGDCITFVSMGDFITFVGSGDLYYICMQWETVLRLLL